ncbi:hypothetical protein [Ureaplasma ceti]|uniref:CopG family transcriptional regulator n=1 Tax=Ureaplasma ceti TaxID=3119530 RepID=A0ABP9U669_9BACT
MKDDSLDLRHSKTEKDLFEDLNQKAENKKIVSMYIPESLCDKLLGLAKKYNISKNEVILRILNGFFAEE